jgi:hypothetical protein
MNEITMGILCQKAKMTSLPGVCIIRCTDKASIVHIRRDPKSKEAVQIEMATGKVILDKAMENPEYISVFGLGPFDQFSVLNPSQLFFKEALDSRPTHNAFSQVSCFRLNAFKAKLL